MAVDQQALLYLIPVAASETTYWLSLLPTQYSKQLHHQVCQGLSWSAESFTFCCIESKLLDGNKESSEVDSATRGVVNEH